MSTGADSGKYAGKIALVTGSSRGIGRYLAFALAAEGASVVVSCRQNAALANEAVGEARRLGGQAISVKADVEDPRGIMDLKAHHLDRSHAMNVRPFVLGAQEAVKLMDRGGRIVAVTSYGSMRGFASYAALGSYKAAVESFIRYMAVEFAGYGFNVYGVNGGLIQSDSLECFYAMPGMAPIERVPETVPLGRPGTVADVSNAIEFLLSDKSSYITGQTLVVDGGMTVTVAPHPHQATEPLALPKRPTRGWPPA